MHTLLRRESGSAVLPPLSIDFAHPEARYVDGPNAFRRDDLDGWLTVFVTAVSFAVHATIGLAREVEQLQRSWRAAQDAIEDLVSVGLIKQLSAGKFDRLYEVPEIFALTDGFEHAPERLAALGAAPDRRSREAGWETPPEER